MTLIKLGAAMREIERIPKNIPKIQIHNCGRSPEFILAVDTFSRSAKHPTPLN